MTDDDLTKHAGKGHLHDGDDRSAPYPVSRLAPEFDLVDIAKQISEADAMVTATAKGKLKVIADQIRTLQKEAHKVLDQTRRDQELHHAACNFKRIPGRIYHLYRKTDGKTLFLMLSPQEWGGNPPHDFLGSYRLENDMSWTPAKDLDTPDDTEALIARLLNQTSD